MRQAWPPGPPVLLRSTLPGIGRRQNECCTNKPVLCPRPQFSHLGARPPGAAAVKTGRYTADRGERDTVANWPATYQCRTQQRKFMLLYSPGTP